MIYSENERKFMKLIDDVFSEVSSVEYLILPDKRYSEVLYHARLCGVYARLLGNLKYQILNGKKLSEIELISS